WGMGATLDFAATANGVRFLGDYLGVTVSRTAAHAVWCLPSHPRGGSADPMHQVTFAATLQQLASPAGASAPFQCTRSRTRRWAARSPRGVRSRTRPDRARASRALRR